VRRPVALHHRSCASRRCWRAPRRTSLRAGALRAGEAQRARLVALRREGGEPEGARRRRVGRGDRAADSGRRARGSPRRSSTSPTPRSKRRLRGRQPVAALEGSLSKGRRRSSPPSCSRPDLGTSASRTTSRQSSQGSAGGRVALPRTASSRSRSSVRTARSTSAREAQLRRRARLATTGTRESRAELPNPKGELRRANSCASSCRRDAPNALTVPQRAVLEGPQGSSSIRRRNGTAQPGDRGRRLAGDAWVSTRACSRRSRDHRGTDAPGAGRAVRIAEAGAAAKPPAKPPAKK